MTEWEKAAGSRTQKTDALERLIPGYSYLSEDLAHRTDEMLCRTIVENLRTAKSDMFNILNTAFELHRELLLKDFESLRDEIDAFTNDIRTRAFRWDRTKTERWLGRLIDYDYRLLTGLGNLIQGIKDLQRNLLSSSGKLEDTKRLDEQTGRLKSSLEELVVMFRERDLVCNIRDATLERQFEEMRSRIRRGF